MLKNLAKRLSMPPETSIRKRLLVYLSVGLMGTWLVTTLVGVGISLVELNEAEDTQMSQLARTLPHLVPEGKVQMPDLDESRWHNTGFVDEKHNGIALWGSNGELLLSDRRGRHIPYQRMTGFANTAPWWNHHAWRVLYLHDDKSGRTLAVSQQWSERLWMLMKSVAVQLGLSVLALPGLAWLLSLSVRRSVMPLEALTQELSERDAHSLRPFSTVVPKETQALVYALNDLLGRVELTREREQRFTADAAHELRSPLAAMKVQADVLALSKTPEEQRYHTQQIGQSLQRAEHLINQLLMLARLDAENKLAKQPAVDWQEISSQAMQSINLAAREKYIRLVRKMPDNDGSRVLPLSGEPMLLQLMLRNLLDNAVRYAPENSTVSLLMDEESIAVCDQGAGIAEDDLARIRDRFYRPAGQSAQGSGLGLSIVERIAELHGLKLELTNLATGGLCAKLVRQPAPIENRPDNRTSCTLSRRWRYLTPDEIKLARQIFSDGIDYSRVKLYRGIPFLSFLKVAISPNGHIYFPPRHYPENFAQAEAHYQVWLIHELTHVWQYQNGFHTWLGGLLLALRGGYYRQRCYRYPDIEGITSFAHLNMEQQADVVAHYAAGKCFNWQSYQCRLPAYEACLQDFLANPANPELLPAYWSRNRQSNENKFE